MADKHEQEHQRPAGPPTPREPPPKAPPVDRKIAAEEREARQAASIGAQVILDFNEDAAVGARGGAGGTIEENTAIRDEWLLSMGLIPQAPSGPPSEERAKMLKEPPPPVPTPKIPAQATRASSLAVGGK